MTEREELAWREWEAAWRSDHPAEPTFEEIRRSVDRQTRSMRLTLGGEVVATLAMLGLAAWVLLEEPGPARLGWGIAAVLHTAVVWGFVLWNRRGIWSPLGESVIDYLAIARTRLERRRRTAAFVIGLVAVEVVALAAWAAASGRAAETGGLARLWSWLPAAVVTGIAIVWAVWQRRADEVQLEVLTVAERTLRPD